MPARRAWHFGAMTGPDKTLPLAAGFPPATQEDWRKLVAAVLKGAPFARLESRTHTTACASNRCMHARPLLRPLPAARPAQPGQ